MRALTLNVLSGGATVLLLVLLALPAKSVLDHDGGTESTAAQVRIMPARHPKRVFGVYVDPWHVDDWARIIGAAPQAVAKFEAFSRNRPLGPYGAEAVRQGIHRMMIAWEPWQPVPSSYGVDAQSATSTWRAAPRTATSCASRAASQRSPAPSTCATRTR